MWYSYQDAPLKFIELKLDRVNEIVAMNKKEEKPNDLIGFVELKVVIPEPEYSNVVGQDDLTRFDKPKGGNKNKQKKRKPNKSFKPNNNTNNSADQPKGNKPKANKNKPKGNKPTNNKNQPSNKPKPNNNNKPKGAKPQEKKND
jgi:hypothetical protein